jgi:hypothetical protein
MGDAAEGLIDADARIQERMEELEQSRNAGRSRKPRIDPERVRVLDSLRLARTELQRQLVVTAHPTRRDQIGQAVAEIERRLAEMGA